MKTIKKIEITPIFVEDYIPTDLKQNCIYISRRYKTSVHLCLCGCGNTSVTPARATEINGICAGWWIDCYQAFGTKHQETHRVINKRFLGITLKDALLEVKNDNFPTNNKSYCLNVIHHTCQHFGISGCNKCEIKNYQRKI